MVRPRGIVIGLGHDLQKIVPDRFASLSEQPGSFFTERECAYIQGKKRPLDTAAGLFAAKEALFKALPAIPGGLWPEIEIRHDERGAPYFSLDGAYAAYFEREALVAQVSISHSGEYASAVALVLKST